VGEAARPVRQRDHDRAGAPAVALDGAAVPAVAVRLEGAAHVLGAVAPGAVEGAVEAETVAVREHAAAEPLRAADLLQHLAAVLGGVDHAAERPVLVAVVLQAAGVVAVRQPAGLLPLRRLALGVCGGRGHRRRLLLDDAGGDGRADREGGGGAEGGGKAAGHGGSWHSGWRVLHPYARLAPAIQPARKVAEPAGAWSKVAPCARSTPGPAGVPSPTSSPGAPPARSR